MVLCEDDESRRNDAGEKNNKPPPLLSGWVVRGVRLYMYRDASFIILGGGGAFRRACCVDFGETIDVAWVVGRIIRSSCCCCSPHLTPSSDDGGLSFSRSLLFKNSREREWERGKENRKKIIGQRRAAFKWRPIRHSLSLFSMQDFLSLPSPTFCCLDAVITVPNQVDGCGKTQPGFHSSKKKERKKRKWHGLISYWSTGAIHSRESVGVTWGTRPTLFP